MYVFSSNVIAILTNHLMSDICTSQTSRAQVPFNRMKLQVSDHQCCIRGTAPFKHVTQYFHLGASALTIDFHLETIDQQV